jgi:hypothetical protein
MEGAPGYVWTTGVVAAVFALPLWRFSMHAITLAHEGGHALIGLLLGGKFGKNKVHLNRDGGGFTNIEMSGVGRVPMLLAGYLGPSAVGYAGVVMLVHDMPPRAVLIVGLIFAIFVLVLTRNAFGLLVSAATIALLWVSTTRAEPAAQRAIAYVWVWFLLMGGARKIPDLYYGMLTQKGGSDAEQLQKATLVGDVVWLFVFWLGAVAALVHGGALMLRHAG